MLEVMLKYIHMQVYTREVLPLGATKTICTQIGIQSSKNAHECFFLKGYFVELCLLIKSYVIKY